MTGAQAFTIEPVILLFVLGLGLIFARYLKRLGGWFDRQSEQTIGLLMIAFAVAFALLMWWTGGP
jgi:hypothetical protein